MNPSLTIPSLTYIDTFHLPFPAVDAYLDATGQQPFVSSSTEQANHDLLLRLPAELSALVFSFLSPAALDAARCVCRAWRIKIMGDTWVLSSVLKPKGSLAVVGSSGQETGKVLHRRLLKKLDSESALTMTFEHPDTWRTRFRECKIEFHMPPPQHIHVDKSLMYNPAFTSVKISDTADFVAFMINERPSPDYGCTLLFYRLGLFNQPIYVGATQYSKSRIPSAVPGIQNMVANRLSRAWVLKLKIGLTIASYLVTSSEAFAKDDDQFKLLPLGYSLVEEPLSARTNGDDKQMIDAIIETLNSVSNMWVFLACLPNAVAYDDWIEKDTRRTRELVIAKHIKTGGLFMLEVSYMHMYNDALGNASSRLATQMTGQFLNVVALLCPPRQDLCFRNFAVATFLVPKRHAMVGILWQETKSEGSRLELYYYNVPCTSSQDTPRVTRTMGSDCVCGSYDDVMASAVHGQVGDTQSCISVQGKRISSIAPHMGGIHPSSPLRDLPDTQTRIHIDEDALGGVQLFCDPDQRGEYAERHREGCLVQKIMVWGRSNKGDSHITLRVFDLSFAVPSRLRWYQTFSHWTDADTSPPKKTYCTCPLHDEGFRVTLPDTSCHTLSHHSSHSPSSRPKSTLSSLLVSSWKSNLSPVVSASKGSVEQCDLPARQEALEREKDFYKQAIKSMKRGGMSNESIESEWSRALLTHNGNIPMPTGWRDF